MRSPPELRPDPDTGIWYVHWSEPAKVRGQRGRSRRATTGTKDLATAQTFFGQWLLMEQGKPAPGKSLTIDDLWSLYHKKHVLVKVADGGERHDNAWKNLKVHFGNLAAPQITEDVVSTYCEKRRAGNIGRKSRDSTIRTELLYLIACLNWCSSKKRNPRLLSKDDVPAIEMPAAAQARDRWLTDQEIERLLKTAEAQRQGARLSRAERFLWLALETASRKTAIQQLTWSRVDFEVKVIDYREPGRAATKKRRSIVPFSKRVEPILQRMYLERLDDDGFVLDSNIDVYRSVKRIARIAGVPGVTPHVLRHTAATHMARRGIPMWLIAQTLKITLEVAERTYSHHCPDDLKPAVNMITGRLLEAAE